MARFTRAEIRRIIGEPCTDEMENSIVAMHIGVVDPLKDELQTLKADAAKVSDLEKEIERLKTLNTDAESWKAKYEKEHADFDEYKNNIDSEKIYNSIIEGLNPSKPNVVLMHDTNQKQTTVDQLQDLIDYGKENGYSFEAIQKDTPQIHHTVNN